MAATKMANDVAKKADGAVETIKKPALLLTIGITYISYIFIFLGISYVLPQYLRALTNFLHVAICLILIYKFNPLRSAPVLTEYDSNLIFFMAIFIIMSTGITEFAFSVMNSLKGFYNPPTQTTI
jgi:hypothetical protein